MSQKTPHTRASGSCVSLASPVWICRFGLFIRHIIRIFILSSKSNNFQWDQLGQRFAAHDTEFTLGRIEVFRVPPLRRYCFFLFFFLFDYQNNSRLDGGMLLEGGGKRTNEIKKRKRVFVHICGGRRRPCSRSTPSKWFCWLADPGLSVWWLRCQPWNRIKKNSTPKLLRDLFYILFALHWPSFNAAISCL